jgi:hypothetical protein
VNAAGALQVQISGAAVDTTNRADAAIPREYLLAQIAGVRAKAPLVDTPIRAESESAGGDLEIAPAAEGTAVPAFLERSSIRNAAGHGSGGDHKHF